MANLLQKIIILTCRPLIANEVKGWGKLFQLFVGRAEKDKLWQTAGSRTISSNIHQLKMVLDLSDWSDRETFFLGRWYDLPLQTLLQEVLQPGDEVVDVGAHVGMFTLAARQLVGPEGHIYAFEPNPKVRDRLNRNIAINSLENIDVFPFGLGDGEGNGYLFVPPNNSVSGRLVPSQSVLAEQFPGEAIAIDIKGGDGVLSAAHPRLIKVDVEGCEMQVLKGLSQTIQTHSSLIICEYIPREFEESGQQFEDLWAIARTYNYRLFKIGQSTLKGTSPLSLIPVKTADFGEGGDYLMGPVHDPFIQSLDAKSF